MKSFKFNIAKIVLDNENYRNFLSALIGKNIFSINNKKIYNMIEDKSVRNISLKKIYPSTLVINLETRNPFSKVIFKNSQYFIDQDGILFDSKLQFNEREIKIDNIEKLKDAFIFSKKLSLDHKINSIEFLYLKDYLVFEINDVKIYLKEENKEELFDVAIYLCKRLKEKSIRFKEIDLRYGYSHIVVR